MVGIYKITNIVNNKCYIGQSVHIERRFREHKNRSYFTEYETPLYKAIKKYGIENFTFEIIEECEKSELSDREIFYINKYNSYSKMGYNLTNGGKGYSGTHTIEHNKKISIAKTGKKIQPPSKETLIKRSESLKKVIHTKEWHEKIGLANRGRVVSEETRKKISESLKGNVISSETREKLRIKSTGRKQSEDSRKKISEKVSKPILQFDTSGNFIKEYGNARIASAETNINFSNISSCCNGKRNKAGGYIWKFSEVVCNE